MAIMRAMSTGRPSIGLPTPPRMTLLRAVFAVVALVSQMVLGSLVLPPAQARAAATLDDAIVLCGSPAPHQHRHPDSGTTRPLDLALELPAVIPLPPVALPPVPRSAVAAMALPPARAPPARADRAAHARDPPRLA